MSGVKMTNCMNVRQKEVSEKRELKPLVGDNVTVCVLDEEKHLGNLEEILPKK